ncbi:putative MFS lactose permease [Ramaria rubella]|nr:putative MFS lactose permease [Ramaria rubella]
MHVTVKDICDAQRHTRALNSDYAVALIEGRLNPWSKESFALYACAMVSFLCSCGNGYDGSLMTGINGMQPYKDTFNSGNSAKSTGITFSIYTIGQMLGALFASHICDKWGRRAGMFVGCVIIICGTAIIASSNVNGQFLAGRFILGVGIAVAIVGAPTYCIEVSPPQWRGRMTSLYNTGWNGGAIPAAAIVWGTSTIPSNWSWRIPLIIQAFPACVVICLVWFCPESPRWLYANGREDEARNNDANNSIVKLELEEFKTNISLTGTDKRWWDYTALYKTSNARWRSLMVFMMGLFGQMSGNGLGYYNLQIYQSLGFDSKMQFAMNLIGTCTGAFAAWIAVSLSDRMPRRKVLVYGTFMCAFFLAANAGLSAKWASYGDGPKDLNVGKLGAAFFFLFGVIYAFTYTPLQSLYPAECLETTARAKGISMKIFVINITSFINLYCIPIGLANIQWRFMLVYVFWDFLEGILWQLFAVETVGRTLEELDEVFSSTNPPATSQRKR